tara:strand:+ start:226 stop:420 length:195 start_codon:yes stop_codon:yes gene_type:complete
MYKYADLDLLYGANAINIMAVILGALLALVTSFNEVFAFLNWQMCVSARSQGKCLAVSVSRFSP